MIMSINIYGEDFTELKNESDLSLVQENLQQSIEVQSVRSILSSYDPLEHTKGQLRAGYIHLAEDASPNRMAYGLAGHVHLYTPRWNGLMVGVEAYTVVNLQNNQKSSDLNSDFFDINGESFILFSQAYLNGKWGNTEIKLGRQSLDTPHADSDDIRMIPNYFEAYRVINRDIENVTLTAGFITKMAGWENGVDSSEFVNVGKTLGLDKNIDGVYCASASYEGFEDLSLDLWYYNYHNIANVIYAQAGYAYTPSKDVSFILGAQYDGSRETGDALLGVQDSRTYGISVETEFTNIGLTVLAALNQDKGDSGAVGLSLGGGPLFTSMEDQTLDVMGTAGGAWIIGAGYNFRHLGVEALTIGVAYGSFESDDASYASKEIDTVLEYNFNDMISASVAYASVDFKEYNKEDYHQLRLIANYNF
ncbi:MAG: OprD family outer membrane porin [Campylobacterota bacterium]|nr:OprD family outer membrane porin [Campylobacterota bacterium]